MNATYKWLGSHVDTIRVDSKEKCCANCRRFVTHYIRNVFNGVETFVPISLGHCTFPQIKDREVWVECKHFEPKIVEQSHAP